MAAAPRQESGRRPPITLGKLCAGGLAAWLAWVAAGGMAPESRRFLAWAAGAAILAGLIAWKLGLWRRLLAFGRNEWNGDPLPGIGLALLWFLGAGFAWMGEFGVSLAREMPPKWLAGWLALMAALAGGAWPLGANTWRRWVLAAMGAALGGAVRWGLGPEDYGAFVGALGLFAYAAALAFSENGNRF
jgi:hypothetical protein